MKPVFFFLWGLILVTISGVVPLRLRAQVTGQISSAIPVKTPKTSDTVIRSEKVVLSDFTGQSFSSYSGFVQYLLEHNAIFQQVQNPIPDIANPINKNIPKQRADDVLFYLIIGIFLLLAIIRLGFQKYFSDLFRAFFSPTLSQRQLREQLSQTPFPALLLNLFFSFSAGIYLYLVLRYSNYMAGDKPLYLIGVFVLLFIIIYLVKYILLRFSGWLFGQPEIMDGYIFTLYLINKIMGIILLPFILILAFSSPLLAKITLDISIFIIILLFVYRYFRVYSMAESHITFSKFHFFIYLCSFEVAPVLILGKLVFIWLNGA